MNSKIHRSAISFIAMSFAVISLILTLILILSGVTHAGNGRDTSSGRLITIHDHGVQKVILSQAETIGDAIAESGIKLDKNDAVEPSVDKKLVASDYQVNIYRARPVLVIDGNVRKKIITPYQTPEQIAQSVGIILYPEDEVSISSVGSLSDGAGTILTINRATAFIFTLYGNTNTVRTQASTVGEMLKEKGIRISKDDHLSVSLDAKISPELTVKLWREGKQTVTVEEDVNFDIEKIENADFEVSYREIKTAGEKGKRSATYEIIIQDGKEVARKEIASLVIKPSKKQIEVVGVKGQYTTPGENETIAWNFLTSHGFSRVQAAGIMGNLKQEHGFNTSGDGLAQWTGGRRAELYSMPYPTNIYTQLDFLLHELTTNYASVGNAIKSTSSLTDAVLIFQNRFEKCGVCSETRRIEYARNILASH